MFCSVVIPTISRTTLSHAVYSVIEQEFSSDDIEVIVVNDSGCSLPSAGWQHSEQVTVLNTNRRERCVKRMLFDGGATHG